jgi:dTDP-4-dehydrorhamnose 3,5-epimerase
VVELDPISDERGWFARTFDVEEFRARGLEHAVIQCNASYNHRRDTLRGLHFQQEPHGEVKLVRCVRGSIFDVAVDLRPESPTYCHWFGTELSPDNGRALYIPQGFAHGFQTTAEGSEVLYQMSSCYVPEAARGVRWDDPAFGIEWPPPRGERIISQRDATFPDLVR